MKRRFYVWAMWVMMMPVLGVAQTQAPIQALTPPQTQTASNTTCQLAVRVDDTLQFRPDIIEIPVHCRDFRVTLRHVGRLPRVASPRNWVLVKAGDADGVARTGGSAGPANDYVDATDARVLASSGVIGRDEVVTIDVPMAQLEPGQTYTFLSTIPGFSPALRGTLTVLAPVPNKAR